jgi:hypothetical protein
MTAVPVIVRRAILAAAVAGVLGALWLAPRWPPAPPIEARDSVPDTLPGSLSDADFWRLSADLSEPGGYFRSENLVSNEHTFQYVIPDLIRTVPKGGVYLGVAPDQNFTYVVALAPKMAFILDIRRGNLLEHLMYKAIIELSPDRADFLSRLFSKKRPDGIGAAATVDDLFDAFDGVETSEALHAENVRAIEDQLTVHHAFPLSVEDLQQIEGIYEQFYWEGPGLRYTVNMAPVTSAPRFGFGRGFGGNFPSYEDLMRQSDTEGQHWSYLASEDRFAALKTFEEKNLLVPVVGDFAGPKALRAIGTYVHEHGSRVSAFYVSNVEQYLFQDGIWSDFYRSVATLPLSDSSTFIRSVSGRTGFRGPRQWSDGRATSLDPMKASVRAFQSGRIRTYYELNARSK